MENNKFLIKTIDDVAWEVNCTIVPRNSKFSGSPLVIDFVDDSWGFGLHQLRGLRKEEYAAQLKGTPS